MRIQHNIMALNSSRQLGVNNSSVSKSLEKLSSGYRINRAGDDAAGLAISEKMRAQIKGLTAASDNSQDAISLVQTAEGGLQEVHSMLNRMQELATKSANGTYTDDVDRRALQDEVDALKDEINRIADSTNFNGIKLLDGSMGVGTTGAEAPAGGVAANATAHTSKFDWSISGGEGIKVTIASANKSAAPKGVTASWGADGNLTLTIDAAENTVIKQADIDKALAAATGAPDKAKDLKVTLKEDITITGGDSAAVADISSLTSAKAVQATHIDAANGVTVSATKAGVNTHTLKFDNDGTAAFGASVTAGGNATLNLAGADSYTSSQINKMLSDAGIEMRVDFEGSKTGNDLKGSGAAGVFTLGTTTAGSGLSSDGGLKLQIGDTNDAWNQLDLAIADMHVGNLGIGGIDIGTRDGASAAISKITDAINQVSTSRGKLGAIQNRLEHTINNLGVTTENITAAESRIRDVDMAKEMMEFTKNSVLMQSAQAMLAQANQQPQSVLQLLQ
ncbi:flagellin [Clostridiales bacterium TF09-2AC]|nr:flagellin [Clostridiales bacterium TF09-2AC]